MSYEHTRKQEIQKYLKESCYHRIKCTAARGEQTDTEADPIDRRQPNRIASSTDRLSRGRRLDGESRSDTGAVLPSELQLQTETVAELNRYRICRSVFIFILFFYEVDKTMSYVTMYGCY